MAVYVVKGGSDGYLKSRSADQATARAGGTITVDTTDYLMAYGDRYVSGGYDYYETFLEFDTSSVVGTVLDAKLVVTPYATCGITGEAWLYDWGAALAAADWVPGASLGSLPAFATALDSSVGWAPASGHEALINQSGSTRLVVCSSRVREDVTPVSTIQYSWFATHEYEALDPAFKEPYLIIHTEDPGEVLCRGYSYQESTSIYVNAYAPIETMPGDVLIAINSATSLENFVASGWTQIIT